MKSPKVSFIVPCYNLAHLLPECVSSILSQTYRDFEILVMDDCSPDNTPEVARSFSDPRVIHVRNETNLRHLANYNKGIGLARGEYVWLISADDRLRSNLVLERYVGVMDNHPEVGYVFCPAMELLDDRETVQLGYSTHGGQDAIFNGKAFLVKLLECNGVAAASGMARKECYEKVSLFPPDMPYAGDWYLWCVFAMYYDVAYFAEPMVNYRQHGESITNKFKDENMNILFYDDIAVLKRIRDMAALEGQPLIISKCNDSIIERFVRRLMQKERDDIEPTISELELLLDSSILERDEIKKFGALIYSAMADNYCWTDNTFKAKQYYKLAINSGLTGIGLYFKYILSYFGNYGRYIRTVLSNTKKCIIHG